MTNILGYGTIERDNLKAHKNVCNWFTMSYVRKKFPICVFHVTVRSVTAILLILYK